MSPDDVDEHRACVNAWMARATADLPADQLLQAFEAGFSALWRRAHRTLGDVTLLAIMARVLYDTAEQHPIFSSLALEAAGLQTGELRARTRDLPRDALALAIRFVLVEFLTVLGNLTGDILTPALHAELRQASLPPDDHPSRPPSPDSDGAAS